MVPRPSFHRTPNAATSTTTAPLYHAKWVVTGALVAGSWSGDWNAMPSFITLPHGIIFSGFLGKLKYLRRNQELLFQPVWWVDSCLPIPLLQEVMCAALFQTGEVVCFSQTHQVHWNKAKPGARSKSPRWTQTWGSGLQIRQPQTTWPHTNLIIPNVCEYNLF